MSEGLAVFPLQDEELSVRALRCLSEEGLRTLADVDAKSDNDLLRIPGFGRTSLREVRSAVAERRRGPIRLAVQEENQVIWTWVLHHRNLIRALMQGEAVVVPTPEFARDALAQTDEG